MKRRLTAAELRDLRSRQIWKTAPRHRTAQGRRRALSGRAPHETDECRTFIAWTQLVQFEGEPLFERVVHIPNERGKAGVAVAILVAIGLRKGFPDYGILAPIGNWHGLFMEAKARHESRVDAAQREWIRKLKAWGYEGRLCYGALELIYWTRRYFHDAGATASGAFVDNTRLVA